VDFFLPQGPTGFDALGEPCFTHVPSWQIQESSLPRNKANVSPERITPKKTKTIALVTCSLYPAARDTRQGDL